MGVFTNIAEQLGLKATPVVERVIEGSVFNVHDDVRRATHWAMGLGPDQVWNTQPYVRTVVTFLARNIAQLGVHSFERVDDDQRKRLRPSDSRVARVFARPNPHTTSFELIFGLVCDKALYERAYWLIGRDRKTGDDTLTRIPPSRVVSHISDDPLGRIDAFQVLSAKGERFDVPASRVLYFPGWNPTTAIGMPSSPLDAIKSVIAEQAAAFEFRKLSWSQGAQVGATVTRPQGVPWKDGARDRFVEDVRSQFAGNGPRRGGVMLLEDGMTMSSQQFNAREAEWIDAAKLSLSLVAAVYHVNPTMVGLLDNANYSNVREFRKMLYGDTLGPIMASIEDRINAFLVPQLVDNDDSDVYVEFNIAEKLQGSFEEQAAAMQTSVGAPWMMRSEARARLNLPPIDGADELVTPLNVLVGGQASPRDTAPPPSTESALASSQLDSDELASSDARLSNVIELSERTTEQQRRKIDEVLRGFFAQQSSSVLSRIGASDDDWWDEARWDKQLAGVLQAVQHELSHVVDINATDRLAARINTTTKRALDDAINNGDDLAGVFEWTSEHSTSITEAVMKLARESAAQIAQPIEETV